MPSEAIIMTADFTCRKGLLGIGAEITALVGLPSRSPRCRNIPDDVRTVQRLLNRFPPIEGGPVPKLVDDGIVGPLTDKAIGHFQAKWSIVSKYSKQPDHIVDPGGKTIARLNKGPTGKTGMPSDFAYFHKNPQKYFSLFPGLTLRNADCYSQFAYDTIGKADFNIETHRPNL